MSQPNLRSFGAKGRNPPTLGPRNHMASLCFDLIYTIGRRCDPKTRTNLCLASKEFYMSDTDWLFENQMAHYLVKIRSYLDMFSTKRGKWAKLRVAHAMFRYMVLHKHLLKHERLQKLRPVVKDKLVELPQSGMCKRKARKYMKELEL